MNVEETLIRLTSIEADCSAVIDHIQGGYGLQSCLKALGITSGKTITRIAPVFSQGPVAIEGEEIPRVVIGYGMASRIMVKVGRNINGV